MKKLLFFLSLIAILKSNFSLSQCTPINCLADLPPYGGLCETEISNGQVNQEYYSSLSFHITTNCIDGALLGEEYNGTSYQVTSLHSFEVFNLPNGMMAQSNQASYNSPANGCAALFGTPTEAGVFLVTVSFMVNANVWLLSSTCSGFFPPVAQNNNEITSDLEFEILPDPSFIGAADGDVFCSFGPDVELTVVGTQGGQFTGEGVIGNMFSPSVAGLGFHQITYTVSAQEGSAIAPTTNSLTITIEVVVEDTIVYYADNDGDGFGNPEETLSTCVEPGEGWVTNGDDCDDDDPLIYPGAPPTGTGVDNNCDGVIDEAEALLASVTLLNETQLLVYPIPTQSQLNVVTGILSVETLWTITDLSGRVIIAGKETTQNLVIDVSMLTEGMYLLRIQQGGLQDVVKFTVVK